MYDMQLSDRSEELLEKVHPKLAEIVRETRDISEAEFEVVEGYRSQKLADTMYEKGVSLNAASVHSYGQAVSLIVSVAGIPCTNTRAYEELAMSMKYAAENVNAGIKWGAARHIDNFCEYEGEPDEAMSDFCALQLKKNGEILDIAPGYFELVLD
tara:strand:+ start:60 stop:524 length:465 start_codon:yes stop_codon:yes gene_type:complete